MIFAAMNKAMKKINIVKKDRVNRDQNFKFRGIDDVYNAVHDAFAEAGVFCAPETVERVQTDKTMKSGAVWSHILLKTKFKFYATDGSFVETGPFFSEGLDNSDKGTNKAMAGGHKYALLQMLMIPTEETKDSEATRLPDSEFVTLDQAKAAAQAREAASSPAPREPSKPKEKNIAPASDAQVKRMFALMKERQISHDVMRGLFKDCYGLDSTKDLQRWQMDDIFALLEDAGCNEATVVAFSLRNKIESKPAPQAAPTAAPKVIKNFAPGAEQRDEQGHAPPAGGAGRQQ